MCRIVFWNLKRKDLTNLVCKLASATDADVLILNECIVPIGSTLRALNSEVDRCFFVPKSSSEERFHCFCRNTALDLTEIHRGFRSSYRRLNLRSKPVVLGLVHGADIRNYDAENRQALAQITAIEIDFVKSEHGHSRLILVGDFNMNPYDRGMNLAAGFNAMMTKACISSGHRTVAGKKYDFYYNPMWSLFGDGSEGPAGTVYDKSNQGPYGWSMLDQVVVHHSIVDEFESVRILSHAGNSSLVDANGRPDSRRASDHLPIIVKLKGINGE